MGSYRQKISDPEPRGERVAKWIEAHMAATGVSVPELAFRLRTDKRDLQRLLRDRSCGHRLEGALAAYFGWDFVEDVFTPAIGAGPITAREALLAARQAEVVALHARIERERQVRAMALAAHRKARAGRFSVGRGHGTTVVAP